MAQHRELLLQGPGPAAGFRRDVAAGQGLQAEEGGKFSAGPSEIIRIVGKATAGRSGHPSSGWGDQVVQCCQQGVR